MLRCCFTTLVRYLCVTLHRVAATQRCTYPSSNYRGSSGWWTVHPADVISRNLSRGRTSFARSPLEWPSSRSMWRKCARKTHELHGDQIPWRFLTGIPPSPIASSRSEGWLFAFLRSLRLQRCDALFGRRWESKDHRLQNVTKR